MVTMLPEALTVGLPADVAVTVDVLLVPSVAVDGTLTFTHTFTDPPAGIAEVVVSAVVHVESKTVAGKVPPAAAIA
jgi:hypothetical protein